MKRTILTHFVGPTNTKGSRYVASAGKGARVIIPSDYRKSDDGNHIAAIYALCAKMGWSIKGLVFGGTERGIAAVWKA